MQSLALNPTFKKLWQASTLSNVGDGIARSAFPLLAALRIISNHAVGAVKTANLT